MTDEDEESPDHNEDGLASAVETRTDSATDVREHRKRGRRKRQDAKHADDFWRRNLATADDRRFLWGFLVSLHTFEQRFACGPSGFPQPEATWFHAGEQDVGLRLYRTWMRTAPDLLQLMHAENDPAFAKRRE